MKILKSMLFSGLAGMAYAQAALAQPSVAVESVQVPESTTSVPVQVDFVPAAVVGTAAQFQVVYDSAALTADISNTCPPVAPGAPVFNWACSENTPGTIQFVSSFFGTGNLPAFSGDIIFDLTSASAGTTYPLTIQDIEYTEFTGVVPVEDVTNGSIEITVAAPEPAYSSDPASSVSLGPVIQGGTDPQGTVAITNTGTAGSTLTGSCSETSDPNNVFTISNTSFAITGTSPHNVGVACDADGPVGTNTGGMRCTHDGGAGGASSPVDYTLSCVINEVPPSVPEYSSDPASGPFNLSAKEDDPAPLQNITISNTGEQGSILTGNCSASGDSQIFMTLSSIGDFAVPQGGTPAVRTVGCNTENAGTYTGVVSCAHNGSNASPVTYDVNCTIDPPEPKSEVVTVPGDGATITRPTDLGGTATFEVDFVESADLGETASLTGCSLADGTNFAITDPTTYPVTIPAGGTVTVSVDGTNPGSAGNTEDTLNCSYTDTDNPNGRDVSFRLVLSVGGDARFEVYKDFTDDSSGDIEVTITCTTGLPLTQTATLSDGEDVVFVVTDFESGDMNCTISEDGESGYDAEYFASGDSDSDDDSSGCHFTAINGNDYNYCDIENSPTPVAVVISKEWEMVGTGGDVVSQDYTLTLSCDSEIVGGTGAADDWSLTFSGSGEGVFTAQVVPNYPYSTCSVSEPPPDSTVEVLNGCGTFTVAVNDGHSCTIVNTVFFEGIPTLSQWGMAIMALLMLGVGMVAFRRFA